MKAAKSKAVEALVKTDDRPDGYEAAKLGYAFKEVEASVLRRDAFLAVTGNLPDDSDTTAGAAGNEE